MPQMPNGTNLVNEMTKALPLFCFSNKRNTKALAEQGLKLSDQMRLEVIGVRDFLEAGGVMCDIRIKRGGSGQGLVMSVTGLDFKDNGPIDEKIAVYKNARVEWLKQEELRDMVEKREERTKAVWMSDESALKISRNAPCPCGSGKKYKHCCGK